MIFTGQNKNNNLVLALLRLVHLGEFDRVELAYLVSGHSYMPCDRKFGNIAQDLSKYESIASPALLEEYIRASQSPACNVFQLKREEIQNINVLSSTDKTKRVVLIRRKGNSFQSASIIVMRARYPDGYLLKKNFKVTDEEATVVKVKLPGVTEKLDLGTVQFEMKYPTQRKLKPEKLADLKTMRPSLTHGDWIDQLIEEQKTAQVYNEDESESPFPADTLGKDNSLEHDKAVKISNPRSEPEPEAEQDEPDVVNG